MERIHSINSERIAWCCDDHGVTLDVLAAEVGVSLAGLHRIMEGQPGGFTFGQLSKIARYFGRGVLFFLEHTPINAEKVHTHEFRTLANQKPELSAKLRALSKRLDHFASRPLATVPKALPTICRNLREIFQFGETSTFDRLS